ncbi:MAG: hypothetical protein M3Y37_02010 [Chloroflexota bacterium]|jgi:hypothetical protein|nr:hypothetical protein [Chloroflexota bacterium]
MSEMPDAPKKKDQPVGRGYELQVSDRATAAMQLAAHFTAESMKLSTTDDPRAALAEQLSYFDLAFRSIMSSTARTMIKASTSELEQEARARTLTNEFRTG